MTAVLDPIARDELIRLLDQERLNNKSSILLATNIPDDVSSLVDEAWFIKDYLLMPGSKNNIKSEY